MGYLIPAPYTGMSSRDAHLRRTPPSGEPGTDYYMPTGTPLGAPTRCRVVAIGGGIQPATGRFVTVDDGTRWIRFLHLLEWRCDVGDELDPGEVFGISGASGYGSEYFGEPYRNAAFWRNTGGDHVHVTAFQGRAYTFGSKGTVDFHALTGGEVASGGSSPFDPANPFEKDEPMTDNLTIYRNGGSLRAVGFDRDFRIGGALTSVTGVDGAEVLSTLVAAGAEVIDLDQRQWDVMMVTLDATAARPAAAQIDVAALAAALIPHLPGQALSREDVESAVSAALGSLILAPLKS